MPKKGNPWLEHVKQVKAANPGLMLKKILKMAGKSYKKLGAPSKTKKKTRIRRKASRRPSMKRGRKGKAKKKSRGSKKKGRRSRRRSR